MTHGTGKVVLMAASALLSASAFAQSIMSPPSCVPAKVQTADILKLPHPLKIMALRQNLPGGCLSGLAAVTYLVLDENGEPVVFWLRNKPEFAYIKILDAEYVKSGPDIDVLVAVGGGRKNPEGRILWPGTLVGQSPADFLQRELLPEKEETVPHADQAEADAGPEADENSLSAIASSAIAYAAAASVIYADFDSAANEARRKSYETSLERLQKIDRKAIGMMHREEILMAIFALQHAAAKLMEGVPENEIEAARIPLDAAAAQLDAALTKAEKQGKAP